MPVGAARPDPGEEARSPRDVNPESLPRIAVGCHPENPGKDQRLKQTNTRKPSTRWKKWSPHGSFKQGSNLGIRPIQVSAHLLLPTTKGKVGIFFEVSIISKTAIFFVRTLMTFAPGSTQMTDDLFNMDPAVDPSSEPALCSLGTGSCDDRK